MEDVPDLEYQLLNAIAEQHRRAEVGTRFEWRQCKDTDDRVILVVRPARNASVLYRTFSKNTSTQK